MLNLYLVSVDRMERVQESLLPPCIIFVSWLWTTLAFIIVPHSEYLDLICISLEFEV